MADEQTVCLNLETETANYFEVISSIYLN